MKSPHILSMLLAASALALTSVNAQTSVTSDVVGYITYNVAANSDAKFGAPLEKSAILTSTIGTGGLSGSTITTTSDVSSADAGYYVQFTSGSLNGNWFQVVSSDTTSITVDTDVQALGGADGDSYKVVPFWTLGTLFTDFPGTTNPSAITALVLVNDVTATGLNPTAAASYWRYTGNVGPPAGFYNSDNPGAGLQNDLIIAPNTYLTIRNVDSNAISLVVAGGVPNSPLSIDVASITSSQNDNLIFNPYPTSIALGSSQIASDINMGTTNPGDSNKDLLLVYSQGTTGLNPTTTASYWYYSGTAVPSGFYDLDNPSAGVQDTVEIPAGGAFVIRKGSSDSNAVLTWTPPLPYSL